MQQNDSGSPSGAPLPARRLMVPDANGYATVALILAVLGMLLLPLRPAAWFFGAGYGLWAFKLSLEPGGTGRRRLAVAAGAVGLAILFPIGFDRNGNGPFAAGETGPGEESFPQYPSPEPYAAPDPYTGPDPYAAPDTYALPEPYVPPVPEYGGSDPEAYDWSAPSPAEALPGDEPPVAAARPEAATEERPRSERERTRRTEPPARETERPTRPSTPRRAPAADVARVRDDLGVARFHKNRGEYALASRLASGAIDRADRLAAQYPGDGDVRELEGAARALHAETMEACQAERALAARDGQEGPPCR